MCGIGVDCGDDAEICRWKEDGIVNSSGDVIGEHDKEGLGVLDVAIVITSGECVHDIDGGDRLVFGENISIGIASSGYRYNAVRRDGVPFHLVCANVDINDEGR